MPGSTLRAIPQGGARSNALSIFAFSESIRCAAQKTAARRRVCLLCAEIAHPQSDRWVQLMQQATQLENQGSDAAALPLEKQAEQIAEATWRPHDLHTGVALNALGIVDDHLEKFGDAETNLKRVCDLHQSGWRWPKQLKDTKSAHVAAIKRMHGFFTLMLLS
jgi:hypothetical protein